MHLSPEGIKMEPRPVVLGLTLCDYFLVEERTKKESLTGTFTGLGVADFPAQVLPFSVFAMLTDGLGSATIIYQFTLTLDGEWLASRRLHVYQRGTEG